MKLFIYGVVQGVGFRPTVYRIAKSLGCRGYVRNNGSNVEICLDKNAEEFLKMLKNELPELARIDDIQIEKSQIPAEVDDFIILPSEEGSKNSHVPPDVAICENCLEELFDKNNRRHLYPFTNCTNCGARFSIIDDVPFDRSNTAMADFALCSKCRSEYADPKDRRFHAQTISCSCEGLKYKLYNSDGSLLENDDPIETFAQHIDKGCMGVIKGWGGMYIVCILEEVKKLREWYRRPSKPFAVMVRDLKSAEKYAFVNSHEKKILTSPQKPIVLLRKKEGERDELLENSSPGLDTVGIYLPYSGIQHVLFHYLKNDGLIMTSANPADEPMLIDDEAVFKLKLDYYLLHNRRIVNRTDDSVLIPFEDHTFFVRKARGYIPDAIKVGYDLHIMGVGAESNVTASISKNGALYTSQYIGNTAHYDVLRFLNLSIDHLIKLLGIKRIDGVGVDLHPQYPTRRIGIDISKRFDAPFFEVQHHWAHAVSLMIDNDVDEDIIALTLDGTGYGTDNNIWGGEVLRSSYRSFKREASLEYIPLLGGDKAVLDPKRVVFAIYQKLNKIVPYYDDRTTEIFIKMINKSVVSSSMGRVLDALSCYLNIGIERTYDGEPAMKLERYLLNGKDEYEFKTEIIDADRKIVRTLPLFDQLYDYVNYENVPHLSEREKSNLAYSFVRSLIEKLVTVGIDCAEQNDIGFIGLSGGVSYNIPITRMVKEIVEDSNLKLLLHKRVPNGDGGISIGQNAIAAHLID
jgi:hydrogenase maturation protein HypF